jgi:hypothetical protein
MNRTRFHVFLLVIVLTGSRCGRFDPEHVTISRLEGRRAICDSLLPFLSHDSPEVCRRALTALGRIGDTTCIDHITEMLSDLAPRVRAEAAFALGQLGESSSGTEILTQLQDEYDRSVKISLIDAFGKVGGREGSSMTAQRKYAAARRWQSPCWDTAASKARC